jgi:hypothetical protein
MAKRPSIPIEVRREVLFEARHRCAVCGAPLPLEYAHIIAWRKTQDHSAENLIALCSIDHERADRENWGEGYLRRYKKQPWALAVNSSAPRSAVQNAIIELILSCDPEEMTERRRQLVLSMLAAYLEVPLDRVTFVSVMAANSSRVRFSVPADAAQRLIEGFESADPILTAILDDFELLAVRIVQATSKPPLLDERIAADRGMPAWYEAVSSEANMKMDRQKSNPFQFALALLRLAGALPNWAKVIAATGGVIAALSPFVLPWIGAERPLLLQAPFDVGTFYTPGNFMGDGAVCPECVEVNLAFQGKPRLGDSDGLCVRVAYSKPAGKGFAGIYWTSPSPNWGEHPGRKVVGATRISFWAAGERGGEVVEFKAGGIVKSPGKPFFDSFLASRGMVRLESDWRRYELDLKECDLKDVIGAFAWSAAANWNPRPLVFYLDDIRYE